jgi:cytochrome P450
MNRGINEIGSNKIVAPDLASPAFKANPYPFYARLRDEAPVWRTTLPDKRTAWLITRYEDVAWVLKDDTFAKDKLNAMDPQQRAKTLWVPGFLKPLERNMLDLDEPDHARLRALVSKVFTPRLIERLRGRVEALCEELLDAIERKGERSGQFELVADYALPLPATVIAELLGVPPEDHAKFHRWSNRLVSVSSKRDTLRALPAALAFVRYLHRMIEKRRADPRDDLITALIRAEEAGDKLSEDELLAMGFLLLVAGHETTVNLISGGTLALLEHPEQTKKLKSDPSLIKSAVEELLRYTPPVEIATERYPRQDVEIGATTIPRGELVLAILGSANRDERHFEDPDVLDLARDPNKHLAFGRGGVHHCLGAPLARMEGQIAIGAFLRRFPKASLAVTSESLRWRRGLFLRGLKKLALVLYGTSAWRSSFSSLAVRICATLPQRGLLERREHEVT